MQILHDFIIRNENGLYCPYGDFYLDPENKVKNALISHAHNDHAKPGNLNVYCTAETADIMLLRYKKTAAVKFNLYRYFDSFSINEVSITVYSAGHILGSAMFLLEFKGVKYLYTGDYKMQLDETCTLIHPVKADILITETTFANPNIAHPKATDEIKKLNQFKGNMMLGVYALGKAQNINRLLSDYCPQKRIFLHHSIFAIHQLYQKYCKNLGTFELYNRKSFKNCLKDGIYMVPPTTFNSYQKVVNVAKVFASGWEKLQTNSHTSLYISDHVDWLDILNMIALVEPQEIWTIHGDGSYLKAHFEGIKRVVSL